MASESAPSFDDLNPVSSNDYEDDDVEFIKLSEGESLVGEIRAIHRGLGEHNSTLLHVARGLGDVVKMWSNRQIDSAINSAGIEEGDVIGIRKTEDTRTYVDENDDEHEYNVFDVRSL